jgi:hypothetical protein
MAVADFPESPPFRRADLALIGAFAEAGRYATAVEVV